MNERQSQKIDTPNDHQLQKREGNSKKTPSAGAYALQQAARMINAGFPVGLLPRAVLEPMVRSLGNSVAADILERDMQVSAWTSQTLPGQFTGGDTGSTNEIDPCPLTVQALAGSTMEGENGTD